MTANRILNAILTISAVVVVPLQIITTIVLGLAVTVTFGLLLLPISLIWALLLFPMVGLSWVCNKTPALRDVIGIVFIPWAVIANTFVALMPSMGEMENRASKLMLCGSWRVAPMILRSRVCYLKGLVRKIVGVAEQQEDCGSRCRLGSLPHDQAANLR